VIDYGALPKKKVHELDLLFNELKPSTQGMILAEWERMKAWHPAYRQGLQTSKGVQKLEGDLRKCLQQCANAFQKFRYAYEEPKLGNWELTNFSDVLRIAILRLKPEWEGQRSLANHVLIVMRRPAPAAPPSPPR
jgi:hypothetical protein